MTGVGRFILVKFQAFLGGLRPRAGRRLYLRRVLRGSNSDGDFEGATCERGSMLGELVWAVAICARRDRGLLTVM